MTFIDAYAQPRMVLAPWLAAWLATTLLDPNQENSSGRERMYFETAVLFLQLPAILLYTVGLGEQLH